MEREKEVNEILDALRNCDFEELIECVFWEKIVGPFKEKYKKPFTYEAGATKGVLMFKDLGFVIKIPFVGDNDDYFYGSGYSDGWNYCQTEEKRFEFAKEYGLDQCFLELKYIGHIDNYPIYLQEYISEVGGGIHYASYSDKERNEMTDRCEGSGYNCFNPNWLLDAFKYYGEEIFYKLLRFIDDYDIDDLHGANLGYQNGQPLIIDYASFNN
jgi:hypothetical protein